MIVAGKPDFLVPKDKLLVTLAIESVTITIPVVRVVAYRGRFTGDEC